MITQNRLLELFIYQDGQLIWKINKPPAKIGTVIGSNHNDGYLHSRIDRRIYLLHRLIFLYHKGFLPEFIDHIDGNRRNNKIGNLREATRSQNISNSKLKNNNTSGFKGVSWNKSVNKWVAGIRFNRKKIHLGCFHNKQDAYAVYCEAAKKYFGEFAKPCFKEDLV